MPVLSRYFVKTSLIYMITAVFFAALIAAHPVLHLPTWIRALQPVYIHMFVVGWLTQLIFGVANWMFPKLSKEKPRGNHNLGWMAYIMLNMGLVLRIIGEPLNAENPSDFAGWLLVISAVLQWIAVWGFILNTWNRVKVR